MDWTQMFRAHSRRAARFGFDLQPWLWLPIAGLLVTIYLTTQIAFQEVLPADLNMLVLRPLLWCYVAFQSAIFWRYGFGAQPRVNASCLGLALTAGVFQVAVWLGAGVLFGFGRSPHGIESQVFLGNALIVLSSLLGSEMARACLLASLGRRSASLAITGSAGLLALVSVPAGHYAALIDLPSALSFAGRTALPALSQNLLASSLALLGGPTASFVYRSLLVGFEWFSPILPDLEWIAAAFFGTLPAALGILALEELRANLSKDGRSRLDERRAQVPILWLGGAAAAVALLFFNTGAFGYRPTLISGPSMEPYLYAGDIAITSPVSPDQIQVGDVISLRAGSDTIVHRVVALARDDSGRQFITRGDANNVDDPPVGPEQVQGRVILRIPKVGWAAIGLRRLFGLFL